MFLRVSFETKKTEWPFFLIINSGSGLIEHANGLHLFFGDYFVAIYLWDVCF